jgi:hypothetical protein
MEYTLSFWAKADPERVARDAAIAAALQQNEDPWEGYIWFDDITLTTDWQAYEITGITSGSDPAAVLHLQVGATTGAVWFDDVRLQAGSRQVWRRDYEGGAALLNATVSAQTIPLGETFRKIWGTQAPAVNDGGVVTHVILPPLDGLVVLRIGPRIYLPVVLRQL